MLENILKPNSRVSKVIFLLGWPLLLLTQENQDSIWNVFLDSLEVTSSRLSTSELLTPRSVSVLSIPRQNSGNQYRSLQEVVQGVPGLFSMNSSNFAQDLRISIRGFGARSAFGIRGLKIVYDGIPATTPDGQSQLDHLDLQDLERVEILRAGSAGLYGNAAGGVIDLKSVQPTADEVRVGLSTGSDGLLLSHLRLFRMSKHSSYSLGGSYSTYSGYRSHSGTRSLRLKGTYKRLITDGSLLLTGQYTHSPKADDAGGLRLEEAELDSRQARDRNVQFDAGESVSHLVTSAQFHKQWKKSSLRAQGYYQYRDFANRLPFLGGGMVEFDRYFSGTSIHFEMQIGRSKVLIGSDIERQTDNRQRFDNVDGDKGPKVLDQKESFNTQGFYGIAKIQVADRWNLELSSRLDHLSAKVADMFLSDGNQSGDRSWWHLSPSGGISFAWLPRQYIFSQWSHSFETPTLVELTNNPLGAGGFNPDLSPQQANQVEVGIKGVAKRAFSYQVALFHIGLKNELVPFELMDSPGRIFYRNAGESRRVGVEIAAKKDFPSRLGISASYTYADYSYRTFVAEENNLAGKTIPGIPRHQGSFALSFLPAEGLYGFCDFWISGHLFADDNNMEEVEGYALVHPRIGWRLEGKRVMTNIYAGLRNAAGSRYYDNIRINAFGGRYYEPAARREWFAGIHLTF